MQFFAIASTSLGKVAENNKVCFVSGVVSSTIAKKDVDDIDAKVLKKIETDYVDKEEDGKKLWDLKKISNASAVAGPLA